MSGRVISIATVLGLQWLGSTAVCQSTSSLNAGQTTDAPDVDCAAWIRELGSPEFAVREQAAAALFDAGPRVLPALAAAASSTDAEVRDRAILIRSRIEARVFDELTRDFVRDPNPDHDYNLPGWRSFSKIAGTGRTAKRMFISIQRRQRAIAECIALIEQSEGKVGDPDSPARVGLPPKSKEEIAEARLNLRRITSECAANLRLSAMAQRTAEENGDIAALLLAAAVEPAMPPEVHDNIRYFLFRGMFASMMRQEKEGDCFRALLSQWFKNVPLNISDDILFFTLQYDVRGGADMARRVLALKPEADTATMALQVLGKYGERSDLPQVVKWIDSKEIVAEFSLATKPGDATGPALEDKLEAQPAPAQRMPAMPNQGPLQIRPNTTPGRHYVCQVGDVALAAGYMILEMDLESAFEVIVLSESRGFERERAAFPADQPELREAARKLFLAKLAEVDSAAVPAK
ncbi:MAG: hypothetical protein U0892_12005 [Pirellulales bacterium]